MKNFICKTQDTEKMNTYCITAKAIRHGIGWTSTRDYITARNEAKAKEVFLLQNPDKKIETCLKISK